MTELLVGKTTDCVCSWDDLGDCVCEQVHSEGAFCRNSSAAWAN